MVSLCFILHNFAKLQPYLCNCILTVHLLVQTRPVQRIVESWYMVNTCITIDIEHKLKWRPCSWKGIWMVWRPENNSCLNGVNGKNGKRFVVLHWWISLQCICASFMILYKKQFYKFQYTSSPFCPAQPPLFPQLPLPHWIIGWIALCPVMRFNTSCGVDHFQDRVHRKKIQTHIDR